jgi:hypothetical protein
MIDPGLQQDAERIHARVIWLVALGGMAVTALLVATAWLLVVPAPAPERPAATPSPLEHGLLDGATGGTDARAVGARRLERTEWVDRGARVVRIPIGRAIDAVVADPRLIGPHAGAVAAEVRR